MFNDIYRCNKINKSQIFHLLKKDVIHQPIHFGFKNIIGDGKGVKICVIDTGVPDHKSVYTDLSKSEDFTHMGLYDKHGHSTAISGIIASRLDDNFSTVQGIAPKSDMYFAKAIKDDGMGEPNAIQSSILFSLINNVDIIVMSFGGCDSYPFLKDVLRKAHKRNICIFAAAGNSTQTTRDADFPARSQYVMSVGLKGKKGCVQENSLESRSIDISVDEVQTTYLANKFVTMHGSSIANAVAAAVAARIIQSKRNKKQAYSNLDIYDALLKSQLT